MSLLIAAIAQNLARRHGLSQEAAGKLMVTGYALGSVASPLAGALVVNQLVASEPIDGREPPRPPNLGAVPALSPPQGLVAGDYVGKPYDEVAKPLTNAGVIVQRIDVKGTSLNKDIIAKAQVRWQTDLAAGFQPLKADDLLQPGDTVQLAVSTGEVLLPVPDVTGLKFDAAALVLSGFKVEQREVFNEKWDRAFAEASAGHVLGQAPDGGENAAKGSVILLTTGKPIATDSLTEERPRSAKAASPVLDGARP